MQVAHALSCGVVQRSRHSWARLQGTWKSSRLCASTSSSFPTSSAPPPPDPHAYSSKADKDVITIHFVDPNVEGIRRISAKARCGSTIVDVAKAHGVDIQAACGQKLQCATCHVILQRPTYDSLPGPGVREGDLLDSTFTLTPTSRLGCQVRLTTELDGMECVLPDASAKGSVRMSLDQPRPRIEKQWTGVAAVAPRTVTGARSSPPQETMAVHKLSEAQKKIDDQRNLAARLESELRQLRAKSLNDTKDTNANAEGSAQGGDDNLAKMKAELQHTRIDVDRLGMRATFSDVIGLEEAKRALREAVVWPTIADPALFAGVRSGPRGLLLYGPPGCGKTMLARAAAAEMADKATFFHIRPGDIMSKFYGESQRRVQALEELVTESAPAIVFFDEVDSLLGSRDSPGVAEHHRATTNALLAWMDGFSTGDERLFFLGATNRPEAIDEAALRRFGRAAEVGTPSKEARLALIHHLVVEKAAVHGHRTDLSEADLGTVAIRTDGNSLADVDRLVRDAFLEVLRHLPEPGVRPGLRPEEVPPLTMKHFDVVLSQSTGTSALQKMFAERARKMKNA